MPHYSVAFVQSSLFLHSPVHRQSETPTFFSPRLPRQPTAKPASPSAHRPAQCKLPFSFPRLPRPRPCRRAAPPANTPSSTSMARRRFLLLAAATFGGIVSAAAPPSPANAKGSSLAPLLDRDFRVEGVDATPPQFGPDGLSSSNTDADSFFSTPIDSPATYADYLNSLQIPPIEYGGILQSYFRTFLLIAIPSSIFYVSNFLTFRQSPRVTLPVQYDIYAIQRYFFLRPDMVVQRLFHIFYHSLSVLSYYTVNMRLMTAVDGYLGRSPLVRRRNRKARNTEFAKLVKDKIIVLGPAMIKLGQAVSTRSDLISKELVTQLTPLQDDVSQSEFPITDALRMIETELGAGVNLLFDDLNTVPITYSSLGMVFKGSIDGQDVAIKVQRPGVLQLIALDCFIVRRLAQFVTRSLALKTNWTLFVDEYASRLFEELDYLNELRNLDKFRDRYAHIRDIYLPKPFPKYCSTHVLTIEWVDGAKINASSSSEYSTTTANRDSSNSDINLVITGIKFSLIQFLQEGLLHADMHNGNMLKTKDGYLAYIDFGIVSEIPGYIRESIICALVFLIHGEYSLLAETFSSLELMKSNDVEVELPLLSESLKDLFKSNNLIYNNNIKLIDIISKLLILSTQFPLTFSDYIINNLRCLSMLEGLALNANPDFKIFNVIYPFIIGKMLTEYPRSKRFKHALNNLVIDTYGRMRWNRIEQIVYNLYQIEFSSSSGSASASSADGSIPADKANLIFQFMFTPQGKFLRDYILQRNLSSIQGRGRAVLDALFSNSQVPQVYRDDPQPDLFLSALQSDSNDMFYSTFNQASPYPSPANANGVAGTPVVSVGEDDEDIEDIELMMTTERELSDSETSMRTQALFNATSPVQRIRFAVKMIPGAVLPFVRVMSQLFVYAAALAWAELAARLRRRQADRPMAVDATGAAATPLQYAAAAGNGTAVAEGDDEEEEDTSSEQRVSREWKLLDSSFVRRTRQAQYAKVE